MTLWEELQARELYYQSTDDEALKEQIAHKSLFVYVGFDPTGESLHLGHLIPLITLCHFGRYGHKPIILIGGGTARVGDPSGKTESRPILSDDLLERNIKKMEKQLKDMMSQFGIEPIFANNAEWLNELHYIDFLREIGRHFSVNRMLSFETYKTRLDGGLSFLEFNYQLLQSYDYLHIYKKYGCTLQMGGSDQWANIVAGTDLIRRVERAETFGYTLPIVTRSDGQKMGKSEKGAVFIDPSLTSPYDFYQYLRNTSDSDVIPFLKKYTFLPLEEIAEYEQSAGAELNKAKELLAFTMTKFIHGEEQALEVQEAATAAFYGAGSTENIPSCEIFDADALFVDLYVESGLCKSKGEARRLIEQGGAKINGNKIVSIDQKISEDDFEHKEALLSAGKKHHMRLVFE